MSTTAFMLEIVPTYVAVVNQSNTVTNAVVDVYWHETTRREYKQPIKRAHSGYRE